MRGCFGVRQGAAWWLAARKSELSPSGVRTDLLCGVRRASAWWLATRKSELSPSGERTDLLWSKASLRVVAGHQKKQVEPQKRKN